MEESLSLTGVAVEVDAEDEAVWPPDLVVPLGLIVGEAVTNALKHAFPAGREGRVRVELHVDDDGQMRPSSRTTG